MKVYCVFENFEPKEYGPDYHELKEIFSTEAKAVDYLKQMGKYDDMNWEIEGWEVKEE
jgi:hypothetical protein